MRIVDKVELLQRQQALKEKSGNQRALKVAQAGV